MHNSLFSLWVRIAGNWMNEYFCAHIGVTGPEETNIHTQDSKFKLWRSEAEHATSQIRRLSTSFRHCTTSHVNAQPRAVPMLGQHLRRWTSIVSAPDQRPALTVYPRTDTFIPANTRHWTNVDLMLAHRLRLCANIKSTLVQCLVLDGGACCKSLQGTRPAVMRIHALPGQENIQGQRSN